MNADKLKKLMQEHDETATTLSNKIKASPRTIQGWMQGRPIGKSAQIVLHMHFRERFYTEEI